MMRVGTGTIETKQAQYNKEDEPTLTQIFGFILINFILCYLLLNLMS